MRVLFLSFGGKRLTVESRFIKLVPSLSFSLTSPFPVSLCLFLPCRTNLSVRRLIRPSLLEGRREAAGHVSDVRRACAVPRGD